jgi:formylglycine-generating enzyme required for sulfatase activity
MKFVLIRAGKFQMGVPAGQGNADASPRHEVVITRPFYIAAHEVTQAQYQAVTGRNPSEYSAQGGGKDAVKGLSTDRHPVENVSWFDAVSFCNALSLAEGIKPFYVINGQDVRVPNWNGAGYRLPTEAEWEYACRAGTTTKTFFGNDARDVDQFVCTLPNSGGRTHPVGEKHPNAWGLYDMYGNVYEWCWDRYDAGYYKYSSHFDPKGPAEGNESVLRGNSFNNLPEHFSSAGRRGVAADEIHGWDFGIRLAMNYEERIQTRGSAATAPWPGEQRAKVEESVGAGGSPTHAAGRLVGAQANGWASLFNGKDLSGWKTHPTLPGAWRVEQGVLVAPDAHSYLYTKCGGYRDFHLRIEARVEEGANSGVYFRAPFRSFRSAQPDAIEAAIDTIPGSSVRTGSLIAADQRRLVAFTRPIVRPGEWFSMEVIAEGNHIVIKVNGVTTADYVDSERLESAGHLALQQASPGRLVQFRKIEIKESKGLAADRGGSSRKAVGKPARVLRN